MDSIQKNIEKDVIGSCRKYILQEDWLSGGVEEYFSRIPGVCDTECGYANGAVENPTYEEVCSDTTGFAETVCILYNPDIVALRILVRQFFKIIDPVSINRQGNDRGSQYRTGIYYISHEDRGPIQSVMFEIQKGLQPAPGCGVRTTEEFLSG